MHLAEFSKWIVEEEELSPRELREQSFNPQLYAHNFVDPGFDAEAMIRHYSSLHCFCDHFERYGWCEHDGIGDCSQQ